MLKLLGASWKSIGKTVPPTPPLMSCCVSLCDVTSSRPPWSCENMSMPKYQYKAINFPNNNFWFIYNIPTTIHQGPFHIFSSYCKSVPKQTGVGFPPISTSFLSFQFLYFSWAFFFLLRTLTALSFLNIFKLHFIDLKLCYFTHYTLHSLKCTFKPGKQLLRGIARQYHADETIPKYSVHLNFSVDIH